MSPSEIPGTTPTTSIEIDPGALPPGPLQELQERIVIRAGVRGTDEERAWLAKRREGITATDAPLLWRGTGAALRVVRERRDPTRPDPRWSARATERGHAREPVIMAWAARRFGVRADGAMYRHADFDRHFATLDGLGVLDDGRPFPVEVKTGEHDLTPGPLDAARVLLVDELDVATRKRSWFWKNAYYYQMQWQMHVVGAGRALFLWEQHDGDWPMPRPVTMEPQWAWVPRDQDVIDTLIERGNQILADVADGRLDDEVDSYDELTRQWAYADAKAKEWAEKAAAVKATIEERIGDAESFAIETSVAKVTLVVTHPAPKFSEALWAKRAPAAAKRLAEARQNPRYMETPKGSRYVKITPTKGVGEKKRKDTGE